MVMSIQLIGLLSQSLIEKCNEAKNRCNYQKRNYPKLSAFWHPMPGKLVASNCQQPDVRKYGYRSHFK